MFLEEIDKNELEYLEKLKGYAKETFIDFYGEKNKTHIENKINSIPIICFDRKGIDTNFLFKKIDEERNGLLLEWFFNTFDIKQLFSVKNLEVKIDIIKDELDFNSNNNALIKNINEILNFEVFKTDKVDYSNKIKKLIKDYNDNYKITFNKLLEFEDEVLADVKKYVKEIKTFKDLEIMNKFVQNLSSSLTENQKESLLNCINIFRDREQSRGFLYFDQKKDSHNEFLVFPKLKALDFNVFMHELNHAISFKFKREKDSAVSQSGIYQREVNFENKQCKEKYDFLNEVVTDYFVSKMNIKILEDKKLLFSNKPNSVYSYSFVLIKPFMDNYFEYIKECFIESDVDKFEKLFGAYNLEALDHLLKDFNGYAHTMQEMSYLESDFERGVIQAKNLYDANVPSYVTEYYNSFLKMQFLMENIERYQINNDLELDY